MKPVIVAELGGSHLGSLMRAKLLVVAASGAGADAVKLQCFSPEQMCAPDHVLQDGPWKGRNLLDLYRQTHTPREWFQELFALAKELEMVPFASVFHPDDVDFLMTLDCSMLKISSFELTDLDLIRHAARTGKPLIISTGMARRKEIENALFAAYPASEEEMECPSELTLLKCTSAYPADASDANLATMVDLVDIQAGGWSVGLSDHTPGIGVAVAAAALGATMIEKHLTLDRTLPGPDHAASLDPAEFAALVGAVRTVEAALGDGIKRPAPSEIANRAIARKSLVARRAIAKGEPFTAENVTLKRPGTGIEPFRYWDLIGRPAGRAYGPDDRIAERARFPGRGRRIRAEP